MSDGREHEEIAERRLQAAALNGTQVRMSGQQAAALVALLRRLRQELNTPYQCYWRDRAFAAERATRNNQPPSTDHPQ